MYSSSSLFLFIGIVFCFSIEHAHERKGRRKGRRNNRHAMFTLLFTIHLLERYSGAAFLPCFVQGKKKDFLFFLTLPAFSDDEQQGRKEMIEMDGICVWQWASGRARVQVF